MSDLSFEAFTKLALRTESKIEKADINFEQLALLLDIFITVGTLLDYTKKGIFYNNYSKMDANEKDLTLHLGEKILMLNSLTPSATNRETCDNLNHRLDRGILNYRIVHGLLGSITESSELAEHLKKYIAYGTVDKAGIAEEYSDGDWYKALMFNELNVSETTARLNVIDKLQKRFPDAYSDESAENRNLKAEREQLEKNIQ